ncbi:TetR/AcrR family transcriptional regulator [Actinokineospora sp. NBRC 105648]|uniref:TetR/AcrR family transcriptional regulator n=1 Tax=Actinokineospora sp. NBRC 105648 TaxID=3032206 RepID=UPI0024A3AA44|nr:TetR/AcrR family transcriptional regulator [Actinokineospora sp. NBRC 105648]GLZ38784.1 TetR family transcriptional regulator [Actinokineospora sp. NBRC 105648]
MNAGRTARDRARAELTQEIKDEARRQLATDGAQLSLRAVARSLGMASSAIYRYFPSRDDLLTALIIDAYSSLGAAVEASTGDSPRAQWRSACHAVRNWALDHRHEYALIYGSPVPGYRAPQDTVAPAARVPLVFVGVAGAAGAPDSDVPPVVHAQADALRPALPNDLPAGALARVLLAWTQLFGMISFELFGQLVGSADPADEFFAYAVDQMADFVGIAR